MGKSFLQRLHAKEYAASWKNPLFSDPKIKERSYERTGFALYSLLLIVTIFACISLVFWAATQDRFLITEITVEGMRSVPNEKIAQQTWITLRTCKKFGVPCLFFWNESPKKITATLQKTYALDQILVNRKEHVLSMSVTESVTLIPLKIKNDIWFATQDGMLQSLATQEEITKGVLIPPEAYSEINVTAALSLDTEISEGIQILTPELFSQIAQYRKAFVEKGMAITSFEVTTDPGKIIAHVQDSFTVYFTPWQDPETQVRRLHDVLKEATPQFYADIRFGERIYVK
jgi:hypothetical protein